MIARLLLSVTLLLGWAAANAAPYFIKFEANANTSMRAQFGELSLGPRAVSKNHGTTFGPTEMLTPSRLEAGWQLPSGETKSKVVSLEGAPFTFHALILRVDETFELQVFFEIKAGGYRTVEIPAGETINQARLREANEALYTAAGRGNLAGVKDALASGADVNYLFGATHPSPVRYAANGKHYEVVDFLLTQGARLRKRDLDSQYLSERVQRLGLQVE
jgi:hypothetical protein